MTPHAIVLVDSEGKTLMVVEPSGEVARCKAETVQEGTICVGGVEIPVTSTRMGPSKGCRRREMIPLSSSHLWWLRRLVTGEIWSFPMGLSGTKKARLWDVSPLDGSEPAVSKREGCFLPLPKKEGKGE